MPSYKRGDIVYADFGWNIGNELGGVHYAVVVENNNRLGNGTIVVVPLTSLPAGKSPSDISADDLYLGSDIIPWASRKTVAKPHQIRAISKMRINKPTTGNHKRARLTDAHLDELDRIIQGLFVKQPPEKAETEK